MSKNERFMSELIERKKAFNFQHRYCPRCGSLRLQRTMSTPLWLPGMEYIDHNGALCEDCGWRGQVEELVGDLEA